MIAASQQHQQHLHPAVSDSNLNAADPRLEIRGWGGWAGWEGEGCLWSGDKVDWLVDSSSQSGTELGEKWGVRFGEGKKNGQQQRRAIVVAAAAANVAFFPTTDKKRGTKKPCFQF